MRRTTAWAVALVTLAVTAGALVLSGVYGVLGGAQVVYVTAAVSGLVGALIASRQPSNSVGWLLCGLSLLSSLSLVPFAYGYPAVVWHHGAWPLGPVALWFSAWTWVVPFGLSMPAILVRFPRGILPRRWRFVDWLAVAGTVTLAVAIAFMPGPVFPFGTIGNPVGLSPAAALLRTLAVVGFGLILVAGLAAVISLIDRFRRAPAEERLQLKWIAFTAALAGIALTYGIVAQLVLRRSLLDSLVPFCVVTLMMPVAAGFAILRYRLYDIDLIINRTLVYFALTAILGGLYAGEVTLFQRLFIVFTGQKSDAALVISAFALATLFTPIRENLQKLVDRRVGARDPVAALDATSASVESVLHVIDAHQIARRLVDESVAVYEAHGGELYLFTYGRSTPFHASGLVRMPAAIEITIEHEEKEIGRLLLGDRRGGRHYSPRDRHALERFAQAVAGAEALALDLGHAMRHSSRPTRGQTNEGIAT